MVKAFCLAPKLTLVPGWRLGTVVIMNHGKPKASGREFRLCRLLIAVGFALVVLGCRGDQPAAARQGGVPSPREIFVASNGWHSAIFIARAAIPPGAVAVTASFPRAQFLGFGWGDADFFPDPEPGLLTWLNAAFVPTLSVVHVTGLASHPRDAFPKDEVVGLSVSPDGFRDLLAFIDAAFKRDSAGRIIDYAPGLHTFSKFYRANGEFHMLNNCNSWTARGLAAAGLPIDPDAVVFASDLMGVVRELAK